jgi:hypothetical protein
MQAKLYQALRAVNAPEELAAGAAEEAAAPLDRLAKVEADLGVIKWMVGTNVALTIAVLFRLLTM